MKLTKDEWKEITIFFEGIASPSLKKQFQEYQEDAERWNTFGSLASATRNDKIIERLKKRIESYQSADFNHQNGLGSCGTKILNELQKILGEK